MSHDDFENPAESPDAGRPARVGEPMVISEDTAHAPAAPSPAAGGPPGAAARPSVATAAARRPAPEPAHAPTFSLPTVLASAVLALICGGAGAWGYHHFLAGPTKSAADQGGGGPTSASKSPGAGVEALRKDQNRLAGRMETLEERVAAFKVAAPPPDLEPIRTKVARIDELADRLDDLDRRLTPLGDKVDQNRDQITDLRNQLRDRAAESAVSSSGGPATGGGDETTRQAARPADGGEAEEGVPSLDRGVELFRKGDYKGARDVFQERTEADPEDARNWYLAALANGFATSDWRGETERLVNEGIQREKAGKPSSATIDSTVDFLTKATGKDWLSAYRRRAR